MTDTNTTQIKIPVTQQQPTIFSQFLPNAPILQGNIFFQQLQFQPKNIISQFEKPQVIKPTKQQIAQQKLLQLYSQPSKFDNLTLRSVQSDPLYEKQLSHHLNTRIQQYLNYKAQKVQRCYKLYPKIQRFMKCSQSFSQKDLVINKKYTSAIDFILFKTNQCLKQSTAGKCLTQAKILSDKTMDEISQDF